jgi:hypothetical protein
MGVNSENLLSNLACIIVITLCNSYFIFEILKLHFFVKFGQDIYYLFIW